MATATLTADELNKYEIIKNLIETNGSKKEAASRIGCTERTINRLINTYKNEGKEGFMHKNRGRKPSNKIDKELKNYVVFLYNDKYPGTNFKYFTEQLNQHEEIELSESTVRNILSANGILSPTCRRMTKQKYEKEPEPEPEPEPQVNKKTYKAKVEIIKEKIQELDNYNIIREKTINFDGVAKKVLIAASSIIIVPVSVVLYLSLSFEWVLAVCIGTTLLL